MIQRHQIRTEKPPLFDRLLSNEIQPMLAAFEQQEGQIVIDAEALTAFKQTLRKIYQLAKQYEAEISQHRWNLEAARDRDLLLADHIVEQAEKKGSNVVLLDCFERPF